jgi:hypothetical protein
MGDACRLKFLIADTACCQQQVGILPLLFWERAIKFVFLKVFKLERSCTSSFLILAEVLDAIDHFKQDGVCHPILSIFLVAIGA